MLRQSRNETDKLRIKQTHLSADLDQPFHAVIGNSPAISEVFRTIAKVAATDANVLISGENGTGKELVARSLHRQSNRADEVFLTVDLGAIAPTLFESELFGHIKGAFTDARQNRTGRFEAASGGTLFLDEIGNLPATMQAKLLTVLENREVTRVGDNTPRNIDIRLICATNLELPAMIAKGDFRQDLYYRVNTVEIALPPLRERSGDIPLLLDHFISIYARKYRPEPLNLSKSALQQLQDYSWPGNVRELKHAVERAVILGEGSTLQVSDFALSPGTTPSPAEAVPSDLAGLERLAIGQALQRQRRNISRTAKLLGISRSALYRRMEKYGL